MDTLKIARTRLGITQEKMAKSIGLTTAAYNAIERGYSRPREITKKRIELLFGNKIDWEQTELNGIVKNGLPDFYQKALN